MLDLFQGRTDDFALQQDDGSYRPARRSLTTTEIEHHFDGRQTVGFYLLREDGMVKVGCNDLDVNRPDYLQSLWSAALEMRIPANAMLREFSGRKGYHLWLFLAEWTPAVKVRVILSAIVERSGIPLTYVNDKGHTVPLIEVYPKQDDLSKTDKARGNLVKLPLGLHRVTKQMGEPIDPVPIEPLRSDEVEALLLPLRGFEEKMQANGSHQPIAVVSTSPKQQFYPCTKPMLSVTWGEGGRNNVLFLLAKRYHAAGYSEQETMDALMPWAEVNLQPALSKAEVRKTIRSGMNFTSMECLNPLVIPYCSTACPIYAREHPATFGPGGPRLKVSTSEPPVYTVPLSTGVIEVSHEQLLNWEAIRTAAAGQLHVFLPRRKPTDWDRELEPLLRHVERNEAPAEVSPDGVVANLLRQWLRRANEDPAQVERRNVWHDTENGVYVFQGDAFIRYVIQIERGVERARVWHVAKAAGGSRTVKTIEGKLMDVWEIPDVALGVQTMKEG